MYNSGGQYLFCRVFHLYPLYGYKTTFWSYDDYRELRFGRNSDVSLAPRIAVCLFFASIATPSDDMVVTLPSIPLSSKATDAEWSCAVMRSMTIIARKEFVPTRCSK